MLNLLAHIDSNTGAAVKTTIESPGKLLIEAKKRAWLIQDGGFRCPVSSNSGAW
jgi:hypothetical protein